jgi:hypothetical protein
MLQTEEKKHFLATSLAHISLSPSSLVPNKPLKMWRISMEFFELKIYAISNTLLALNSFAASKVFVLFNIKAPSLFHSTISYKLMGLNPIQLHKSPVKSCPLKIKG